MCGRVCQFKALSRFPKSASRSPKKGGPRRNVAPSMPLLSFTKGKTGVSAHWMSWGFSRPATTELLANARSETVAEKKIFKDALASGRCVVPIDGFYEWRRDDTGRWPWYFSPIGNNDNMLWLAAISREPSNIANEETSALPEICLLTTTANAVMSPIHFRMPVLLDRGGIESWLQEGALTDDVLHSLTTPSPGDWLQCHRVSPVINRVDAPDSPDLIKPWVPPVEQGELF
ncbi:MAG: SOS response-associated peptidase [Puniceicoccales bacterium]|jgi:putative SOS response-associated peptidase YedK|nr:SOS response-associated peptidase [Puniceicoccales bacterium]